MIMINHNLRVFLSVAETGSFTASAERLFISQPAVSRAIKALEEELKVKLFDRDKRKGLMLTDAGEKILMLARQMADVENRIYQTAFRENNFLGGRVRIASMPILSSMILSKVFHDFREKYPFVTLELMEGSTPEIRRAVEEHQVDLGFTASPFGDLDAEVVLQDRMVAIGEEPPTGCPIDLREGANRFILCRAGYETALEELRAEHIRLPDSFIVQQAETVIHFVRQKNGIGVISELVLEATPNDLCRFPVTPEIKMDIGIVANDLTNLSPVASQLRNRIREQCRIFSEHRENNG